MLRSLLFAVVALCLLAFRAEAFYFIFLFHFIAYDKVVFLLLLFFAAVFQMEDCEKHEVMEMGLGEEEEKKNDSGG